MSLESKIVLLIAAVEANTAAISGNATAPVSGTKSMPATATLPPIVTPATPPVQNAAVAPVAAAVVPATQPVAAAPVAASPSSVAPAAAAVTLEQLQQEVTAVYQKLNGDPRVMQVVNQYGAALSAIPAEQYAAVIAAVRAL